MVAFDRTEDVVRVSMPAVPAATTHQQIVTLRVPGAEGISSTTATQHVGSSGRREAVGASPAPADVRASLESDGIVPEPPVNAIGVDAGADLVAPGSAPDLVVTSVAVDQVAPTTTVDEVVATPALILS